MRLILTPEQLLVDDRKLSSYFRFADNPPRTPFFTSHNRFWILCESVTRRILDEHGGPTRTAKKLLCCSWVRDLVAVGEGRQERNKGIFLPVCELKVPQLSFVEVG
jgi:hypothetical protein